MAERADDLKRQIDIFSQYCEKWKLKVNFNKTNVMIFSNGRIPKNQRFSFDGKLLEIVERFNYLGIVFSKS